MLRPIIILRSRGPHYMKITPPAIRQNTHPMRTSMSRLYLSAWMTSVIYFRVRKAMGLTAKTMYMSLESKSKAIKGCVKDSKLMIGQQHFGQCFFCT